MAGAFLSKGIIGVTIPAATAVVFLIIQKDISGIRRLLLSRRILLFLAPIFLWVGSVWWLERPGIFMEVIRQSLFRFFSHSADHAKPPHFYFFQTFIHLMPWTLLPLVLPWRRLQPSHLRKPLVHGSLSKFAAIWFAIIFVGLSLSSAKRALYLGPIYPPFSLMAALGWDLFRERFPKVKRKEVFALIAFFLVYKNTC
jgi:4-amino-4-deoxy-L-arabinose transferase-like glycosyltransferase